MSNIFCVKRSAHRSSSRSPTRQSWAPGHAADRRTLRRRTGFRHRGPRRAPSAPSTANPGPPIKGIQDPADQLALNIALEKALFVFAEQPVAIQAVGQCGEAAAGNPGDDINRVEQPLPLAVAPDHLGVFQRFEDPEENVRRASRRPRTPERQYPPCARILLPGSGKRYPAVGSARVIGALTGAVAQPPSPSSAATRGRNMRNRFMVVRLSSIEVSLGRRGMPGVSRADAPHPARGLTCPKAVSDKARVYSSMFSSSCRWLVPAPKVPSGSRAARPPATVGCRSNRLRGQRRRDTA